ncbi:MAG TPA: nuclease-related domain-containing protein [Chitinophagales bacterium]|nr:nuclease-related domain-containing protein [Chitinophagales bacterium]HMW12187.1 nuclease-related domain-containing protein [Chitinophagales bacterium]HMX59282.1 nuclease-related domain-containing protein [Chitinophagales bacterium]HMY23197.1 nuclease-related domain-containing protein [Chitinophagales bacterium]HMZ32534.1 nuclease-related domain-containing protein [Chitinophagales bacterium]
MSRIYNTIGSLTTLKLKLKDNQINDFHSLNEVINFQKSFHAIKQEILIKHEDFIEREKKLLVNDLQNLESEIITLEKQYKDRFALEIGGLKQELVNVETILSNNFIQKIRFLIKKWILKRKIRDKEFDFNRQVEMDINLRIEKLNQKKSRFQFITLNTKQAVVLSAQKAILELERKKAIVDSLNSYIYGSIGENKVVKTLDKLSDEYYLINDFSFTFSPAIYYNQEDEYIKSIQLDHILIGPSGVFLIETKNWSEKSIDNLDLRSPVCQIRRSSFALFKLLNSESDDLGLQLNSHHWGSVKISIKNLIVLLNSKPKGEFQYVKILTLNELIGYISYFKPIFTHSEVESVFKYIYRLNEQN